MHMHPHLLPPVHPGYEYDYVEYMDYAPPPQDMMEPPPGIF